MTERHHTTRIWRRAIAVSFLVLFASAPAVEAALLTVTFDQRPHVEAEAADPCVTGHDEAMCQLCKLIEIPGQLAHRPIVAASAMERLRHMDTIDHRFGRATFLSSTPSRAPPII